MRAGIRTIPTSPTRTATAPTTARTFVPPEATARAAAKEAPWPSSLSTTGTARTAKGAAISFAKGCPPLIKNEIERHQLCFGRTANVDEVHASLHEAHVECNKDMRGSNINDAQSGTTSVGVYIHADERKITVSNDGDSRIVLGTTDGSMAIQAVPLSKDHTPYRADEAARCRNVSARILSFGQIDPSAREEGDEDVEDPPRVRSKQGNYPGTAFTRSLGDSVAESLGVCAEPEMLTLPISSNERLLVLASDGV